MKKGVLLLFFFCIMLFCRCDVSTDFAENQICVPKSSDEFGKSIASELESIILDLHKRGTDYSNMDNSYEIERSFYDDLYTIRPDLSITRNTVNPLLLNPDEFVKRMNTLTDVQIKYINLIIKGCTQSETYDELYIKLKLINDDIILNVPIIQQERLLNVISVLYHSMKTIENLENQGITIQSPTAELNNAITKSYGSNCRKVIAATWAAALWEPSPFGEAIAFATTVVIAGQILYEIIVCKTDYSYCQSLFENCYSDIPDGCSICLQFCLTNGYWPPYGSHRCSYPEPTYN